METHGRPGRNLPARRHLLVREPAAVGKGEFELVAVELRPRGAQAGGDFGQFELPDTRELVADLRLLLAQLLPIGEVLPLAAAADPEVLAEGLDTQRRASDIADHIALHVAAPPGADLHVHHVARYGHRYEDHHILPTPHRLAFGGEGRDLKPLKEGIVRSLSCHRYAL